ncbi:TonB-dependent receptor [Phenylobacterium sp. LjRoot225]|uniref:TonB-dependent receptor n=1 Tax=Phenylobacterium sp. LjRoot225 TaxID=3342285 RepID=UPI003ECF776E
MKIRATKAILLGCTMLATPAAVAHAADAPADPAVSEGSTLGEIIVTARRREENVQDVPLSVSAISGDALTRAGVKDVQGLQYQTPSLTITTGASQRNIVSFAMRGQRTQETQLFTDPPVGTYFAEVVQPRPYGFGNSLYDLESVQVLKGVQGTLFGRNMTGGAVLVEPRHPVLNEFSGEIRGSAGNHQMRELYAQVNVPVNDVLALRFAGVTRRREGWSHEVTTGRDYDNQHYDAYRVSALFKPTDTLQSLTVFDWYHSDEHGTAAFLTSINTAAPSLIATYEGLRRAGLITTNIPAEFAAARALFANRRFSLDMGAGEGGNLDALGAPYEKTTNWGITNKTTWDITENLTIKNIIGYRKNTRDTVQDYDGIPAFLITPYQFANVDSYSEELQLQGSAFEKKLTYILGAYYFREAGIDGAFANTLPQLTFAGARVPQSTPAARFINYTAGSGPSKSYAAFAAGTYHITNQVSVSGGVRYNEDKRTINISPNLPNLGVCQFDTNLTTPGVQSVPIGQCHFTNSKSFNELTYDGTLQWEPSDAITTYVSYRHGYRAGGFSTRAVNAIQLRPFEPETVNEIELGLKTNSQFGPGRLKTSTALFRQNGSNVQKQRATSFDTNGDGVPDTVLTVVDNTAKQRNTGGEFEASYNLGDLTLSGFYAYTKIKILRGAAVAANGAPEIAQRGVPKHSAGLTATYRKDLPDNLGQMALTANGTWRSKIYLDDFELEGLQKSYALLNLRAEWNNVRGSKVNVAVFGNNVTNDTYRIGVLGLLAENLGFQSSVYGEPRMYGVEVSYRF